MEIFSGSIPEKSLPWSLPCLLGMEIFPGSIPEKSLPCRFFRPRKMNLPILSNALAQFLYGKPMASIPLLNRVSRGIEFPLKGKIISKLIPNVFYVFLMFLGLFASALANFPKTKKNGSVYYRAHLTFSSPEPPKIRYRGGQVLEPKFLPIPKSKRSFQS